MGVRRAMYGNRSYGDFGYPGTEILLFLLGFATFGITWFGLFYLLLNEEPARK